MRPAALALASLLLLCACPNGGDDNPNPKRLYLKATEIIGTIELVAEEPDPY